MSLKYKHDLSNMAANKKDMLTHQVTRSWVLIPGRSLKLFFRELAVSGAATRDKHRVPDGKLLERNKNTCLSALKIEVWMQQRRIMLYKRRVPVNGHCVS